MIRHLMLCPVVLMCSALADVWLTISSRFSVCMSRYWALGKFGEHERGANVARGVAESNSNLMSALRTSQVLNISTYAQTKHELIVL